MSLNPVLGHGRHGTGIQALPGQYRASQYMCQTVNGLSERVSDLVSFPDLSLVYTVQVSCHATPPPPPLPFSSLLVPFSLLPAPVLGCECPAGHVCNKLLTGVNRPRCTTPSRLLMTQLPCSPRQPGIKIHHRRLSCINEQKQGVTRQGVVFTDLQSPVDFQ